MKHASVDRAKRVDSQCRNHGACPRCRGSRTFQRRRLETMDGEIMDAIQTAQPRPATVPCGADSAPQDSIHRDGLDDGRS